MTGHPLVTASQAFGTLAITTLTSLETYLKLLLLGTSIVWTVIQIIIALKNRKDDTNGTQPLNKQK